ncbi:MAG TPA: hypothetical protein VF588_17010 [Pyrinomonadaceae bacterium]|jgi:hypothetical protein
MRKAANRIEFGAASRASVGARRAGAFARALVLLAGCALLTACPPDGGDLVPDAVGEGASVVSTNFGGDTLVVTREGVTLRARGLWSVADAATSVILEASNANEGPAAIDFNRAELSKGGGGRMILRSVARGSGGATNFLSDKRAEVGGGAAATFVLHFEMDSGDGSAGVPRDVTGQTVTLRLPLEVGRGGTRAAEFVFGFRYAERRPRG